MSRLTERDGRIAVRVGGCTKRHDPVFDKLAHYEDLEEQGRLVVLPCKVGDRLWAISESKAEECLVVEFNISGYGCTIMTEHDCGYDCEGCPFGSLRQDYSGEYSCEGEYGTGFFKVADFGKTIFPTKAEAEAKLAEMGGGGDE